MATLSTEFVPHSQQRRRCVEFRGKVSLNIGELNWSEPLERFTAERFPIIVTGASYGDTAGSGRWGHARMNMPRQRYSEGVLALYTKGTLSSVQGCFPSYVTPQCKVYPLILSGYLDLQWGRGGRLILRTMGGLSRQRPQSFCSLSPSKGTMICCRLNYRLVFCLLLQSVSWLIEKNWINTEIHTTTPIAYAF